MIPKGGYTHMVEERGKRYKFVCEDKWWGIRQLAGRWTVRAGQVTCPECLGKLGKSGEG